MHRVTNFIGILFFGLIAFLGFADGVAQQREEPLTGKAKAKASELKRVVRDTTFLDDKKGQVRSVENEIRTEVLPNDTLTLHDHANITKSKVVKEETAKLKDIENSVQRNFAPSKFKTLKIDTGTIALDKESLTLRGKQFLETNDLSNTLPLPPHQRFNTSNAPAQGLSNTLKQSLPSPEQKSTSVKNSITTALDTDAKQVEEGQQKVNKLTSYSDQQVLRKSKSALQDVQKIYSEKYIRKLRDSLGLQKADSIFKIASPLMKKEVAKEDMIQSINASLPAQQRPGGVGVDPSTEALTSTEQSKLNGISDQYGKGDVSKMKLPADVLQELPPLAGKQVNSNYMHLVDSMRAVNLNTDRLKLEEDRVTDNIKASVVEKKQSFWDKSYGEGVLGILQNQTITIVQFSPSLGYHFTDYFSLGAGPNLLITAQDKMLHVLVGLRCFSKVEFYKRRVYLQLEDNINNAPVNTESFQRSKQTILAGGGVLLPITKSIALNPAVMYKVNNGNNLNSTGSSWVFRLGISSIKVKK